MICSISLNFQLMVYGLGHPCLAVQVPGVAVTDLQVNIMRRTMEDLMAMALLAEAQLF